jgi:hypothetical protein
VFFNVWSGQPKNREKTSSDKTRAGRRRHDAATAPCLSMKGVFPRRQTRSSRRSGRSLLLNNALCMNHAQCRYGCVTGVLEFFGKGQKSGQINRYWYLAATPRQLRTSSRSARLEHATRRLTQLVGQPVPPYPEVTRGVELLLTHNSFHLFLGSKLSPWLITLSVPPHTR